MIKIAAIDLMEGKCVRLHQGDYGRRTTYSADPVAQAQAFQAAGFDRIHVVDLEGARAGAGKNREVIARIAAAVELPVQVGGGIRTAADVEELLASGVRRLILGTVVVREPEKVERWLERWGSEPFTVSLDVRKGRLQLQGWTEAASLGLGDVVERVASWRVPEVICTDVERDGTLEEPAYDTYRELLALGDGRFAVLAAGGVSRPEQIVRLEELGVRGVIIGKALYEGLCKWEDFLRVGTSHYPVS
ncbi:MAG: 1-(5-phosphoribosyl)-5-[(5-phosphoribosylamino) methylideneamino]imidazole-4-carboxamide isomerase [Acidobacteriota bacterium]